MNAAQSAVAEVCFQCWLFRKDRRGLDDLVEALVEALPGLDRDRLSATLRAHLGELMVHELAGFEEACVLLGRLIAESLR